MYYCYMLLRWSVTILMIDDIALKICMLLYMMVENLRAMMNAWCIWWFCSPVRRWCAEKLHRPPLEVNVHVASSVFYLSAVFFSLYLFNDFTFLLYYVIILLWWWYCVVCCSCFSPVQRLILMLQEFCTVRCGWKIWRFGGRMGGWFTCIDFL